MPSILNLKFKGNKSFVAFSNLSDADALTKTWKVWPTARELELEVMASAEPHGDTDNAKSKREFKKLSKCMGDKLDKEKGRPDAAAPARSIEELEAPDFKRNPSVEMIRQRAAEKERLREANQQQPGTIKRMQFTFSVDQPAPAPMTTNVKRAEPKRQRPLVRTQPDNSFVSLSQQQQDTAAPSTQPEAISPSSPEPLSLKFPSLFNSDFGPSALLYPTPTLTNGMNYGEGLNPSTNADDDSFSVARPTIELPLDELLHNVEINESSAIWMDNFRQTASVDQDVQMAPPSIPSTSQPTTSNKRPASAMEEASHEIADQPIEVDPIAPVPRPTKKHTRSASKSFSHPSPTITVPPVSQAVKEMLPETVAPTKVNELFSNVPSTSRSSGRPTLTVRTQAATPTTRSSGPGATATSLNPAVLRGSSGNSAPGGVKAECSNCGATHTPLWRRGLNDELNCNACGLYCKLHKRPRPKSMRNNHGEGRTQAAPRQETVDVMAQCYNCHTTATPLWRKDDEGKTVCNACGLYYKLHGSARPISMKSDVIRKRSRHDARRANSIEDTPSTSPGASRRTSPVPENNQPTLAPDTSTAPTAYEYTEQVELQSHNSELMHALGTDSTGTNIFTNAFNYQFPGPYHPDHLVQMFPTAQDTLPFSHMPEPSADSELMMSPRSPKRRRMSTDSASEPPSSAVSYTFTDGYSPASSATSHSQRSTMDFPYSAPGASGPALRGSGNTFWHPPMLPQGDDHHSAHLYQGQVVADNSGPSASSSGHCSASSESSGSPSSVQQSSGSSSSSVSGSGSSEDSPMDYLHPPMLAQEEELFSTYLHPPMVLPDDGGNGQGMHSAMHYDYSAHSFEHEASMKVY
ncbi:hypothetical protein H1R20_g7595, partial [Candolleomyces eurysporus]